MIFIKIKSAMLLLISIIIFTTSAYAEDYYVNGKGVTFGEREYEFISSFYFDGYQDFMSMDDYQEFIDSDIMNGEIKIVEKELLDRDNLLTPYSLKHETDAKILKLATSCSTTCTVTTTLSWKKVPNIKSYDLIGAYTKGTVISKFTSALLYYGSNKQSYVEKKITTAGISSTFKLPDTSDLITVMQQFVVKKGGTVYVSYQHAKKEISLANSSRYGFSDKGYGGVFEFDPSIESYYDNMSGLSIEV